MNLVIKFERTRYVLIQNLIDIEDNNSKHQNKVKNVSSILVFLGSTKKNKQKQ